VTKLLKPETKPEVLNGTLVGIVPIICIFRRKCRITAFSDKDVCRISIEKPVISTIKKVYYGSTFTTQATECGCKNKLNAIYFRLHLSLYFMSFDHIFHFFKRLDSNLLHVVLLKLNVIKLEKKNTC
jgi:hypothetical protein